MRLLLELNGGNMKNIYRTGLEFFCVVLIAIFPAHCWPHSSSQSDNYSDWNTYVKEIEGPGKDEFKIIINETQEGLFKFSWKIQNLSQSNFEFSLNSRRQDRCKSNEFTESGIYNVEKGDILVWKFSYLGSGSNKVWLAFPESYAIKSSNKADRRDYFNASPDFSITNSNLDTRILPEFKSSDILVEPIWPKEGSILSANSQIPFKFIPLNLTTIPQCVLFIDDKSIYINNKSRNIELNRINIFETTITELGWHSWSISCYDCQGKFTNSRNTFFKIQNKNNTTYVNLDSSNPSNFSYSNIKDAMNNVSPHGTVYIENGLFYENLIIDKSIKLIGHNGSIDLFRKNKDIAAIEINSNDVEIKNLTLKNCTVAIQGGINGSEGDNYLQRIPKNLF